METPKLECDEVYTPADGLKIPILTDATLCPKPILMGIAGKLVLNPGARRHAVNDLTSPRKDVLPPLRRCSRLRKARALINKHPA